MANKKEKKKGEQKKKKKGGVFSELRYGRYISIEFFKKNAWLLIALIAVVISLMGLRYKTKTQMMEIVALKKELKREESNKLRAKAKYMSLIRETEMLRLVRENNLSMEFQDEPPYEIEITEE